MYSYLVKYFISEEKKYYTFYLLYFFALFLQFPLNNSLPQNIDTWYNLSSFKLFSNSIESFLFDEGFGYSMYPYKYLYKSADPTWGSALVFNCLSFFVKNKIWCYYIFISLIYSLNAISVFCIIRMFGVKYMAAFFGGFAFASSNYAFALLDNQNAISLFPSFFSMYFYLSFLLNSRKIHLFYSAILGGISVYFCSYSIIYSPILILFSFIYGYKKRQIALVKYSFFLYVLVLFFLCFPLIFFIKADFAIPVENNIDGISTYSLHLKDITRAIKGNVLVDYKNDIVNVWKYNTRSVYVGFLIVVLSFFSLFLKIDKKFTVVFSLMFILCFLLALGPYINVGDSRFFTPLYCLYKVFPLSLFFRSTSRIYLLCIFVFSLFSSYWINYYFTLVKGKFFVVLFILFYFFENVPFSFEKFNSDEYISLNTGMNKFLKNRSDLVVANFPTNLILDDKEIYSGLNPLNREYIYLYWFSELKCNTINGFSASYNSIRFRNNDLIRNIDNDTIMDIFLDSNSINYILYHKKLKLIGDPDQYAILVKSKRLVTIYEDRFIQVFKVKFD